MAILNKTTIDATEGLTYVPFSVGLSLLSIIAVHRTGTQYDKVTLSILNNGEQRQWAADNIFKRIRFPSAVPFLAGEKVFVIYKTVI